MGFWNFIFNPIDTICQCNYPDFLGLMSVNTTFKVYLVFGLGMLTMYFIKRYLRKC